MSGGYHYILLMDAATRATLAQYPSSGQNGSYEYDFTGLAYEKSYFIYAGTDTDNDGYICGEGETCGAYISLDQPVDLTVHENTQGINFTTDINISIPDTSSEQLNKTGNFLRRNDSRKILK